MCFVLCLMPEQVGGEFLAGVIINVSLQMIQENRDGILIRILRLGSFSFNTHAGARRCASRHEAASTNVKITHGPAAFFTRCLHRNDEKGSRDVLRSLRRVERSQLSKGEQSVTCMVIVKRRKGGSARRLGPSQAC